jgi:general secretion pathway protein G
MQHRREYKQRNGFTIVELLIVIVVIAILAAITIVAFNGVQTRAENTKTITAVNAYQKALRQYAIENGSYPTTGAFCLGDQYEVLNGTTAGCRYSTSVIGNTGGAAARDLLKPYIGNTLPMPSTKIMYNSSGTGFAGIYFYGTSYGYSLNGEKVVALWYTIQDTTCPVGPVYANVGAPTYTGSPVARTTAVSADSSICMLLLPDASRL